jgi:hypothetical protein
MRGQFRNRRGWIQALQRALDRANQARDKMRGWEEWDDRAAEIIHGQRWRDNTARITLLTSQILDADIALALFDQEHPT